MSVVLPKFTKFRTVLALAGTVLLSFLASGLLHGPVLADPPTAVGEFTRLNVVTIKATCGGQACYYMADAADLGSYINFYRTGTLPAELCSDRLYRDPNQGWSRATVAKEAGACSATTVWTALAASTGEGLDKGGSGIYWYQEPDGTLHTVTGGDRTWKLVAGSSLGISGLKNAYVQPSGGTCPTVLLQYDSGSWGYVAPVSGGGDLQSDAGSVMYRQIVGTLSPDRVGSSGDLGGCDASSKTIKENADNALAAQIGGESSYWEGAPPRGDWIGLGTAWTNAVFKFAVTPVGAKADVMAIAAANEDGTCPSGTQPDANGDCNAVAAEPSEAADESSASCGSFVEGIGWIVCPVLNAMSGLNDAVWSLLVENLLVVNPLTQTDNNGADTPVYTVWQQLRTIGNALLIIAFLIIIYSQLTGTGVSNYGVKKTLPRLILVAIAVNVSFYLVAILVDVFNILGSGLYDLLTSVVVAPVPSWTNLITLILGFAGGTALIIVGVSLAGGIQAALIMLLPAALVALLGFLAALLTLIVRQALLPILAILAPVAFVAYLFPNTEQWFRKWRTMLISMLALFPTAALLFGGVQIAAITVAGDQSNWFAVLIALIMMGLPLFMLPFIARQTGPMLGKLGGAMSGLAGRVKAPLTGALKPRADLTKSRYGAQAVRTGRRGQPILRDRVRAMRHRRLEGNADRQREAGLLNSADEAAADAAFASRVVTDPALQAVQQQSMTNKAAASAANAAHQAGFAQGLLDTHDGQVQPGHNVASILGAAGDDPAIASAIAASVSRATQEAIKEAELSIAGDSVDQLGRRLQQAMRDGDTIGARAAQNRLYNSGGIGVQAVRDAVDAAAGDTDTRTLADLRSNILQNHGALKSSAADQLTWATGNGTMSAAGSSPATWNMSDAELMQQNWRSQSLALASGAVSSEQAARIIADSRLAAQINPETRAHYETLGEGADITIDHPPASGRPPTTPT